MGLRGRTTTSAHKLMRLVATAGLFGQVATAGLFGHVATAGLFGHVGPSVFLTWELAVTWQ